MWVWVNNEESSAWAELTSTSDRTAAIVGALLVDQRLTRAIVTRCQRDNEIETFLFRPSGPIGSFGAKIRLAFLMNMISRDAYTDLRAFVKIRNDFAHELGRSFEGQSIKDQCASFSIIEKHIHEWVDRPGFDDVAASTAYLAPPKVYLRDKNKNLTLPRFRYLATAALFGRAFGCAGLHIKEGQLI